MNVYEFFVLLAEKISGEPASGQLAKDVC